MNSKDENFSGAEAASEELDADRILHEHFKSSEMKRAAAKELIERYYFQVKDGCGNDECTNEHCASSGKIQIRSADQAAAQALRLFQTKAQLCVANPAKVAKILPLHPGDDVPDAGPVPTTTTMNLVSKSPPAAAAAGSSRQTALPAATDIVTANPVVTDLVLPPMPQSSAAASTSTESSSSSSDVKPAKKKEVLFLTDRRVKEIVDICHAENTFSLLIRTIGQVYCSAESLMLSFRRPPPSGTTKTSTTPPPPPTTATITADGTTTSTVLSKESLRAVEHDLDKDCDSSQQPTDDETGNAKPASTIAAATALASASGQSRVDDDDFDEDDPPLRPDEITLDLESLRRAYKILYDLPSLPFQGALVNALLILFENAELELRFGDAYARHRRHYLNVFVAVLEIPALGHHLGSPRDPHLYQPHEDFVDVVLPSLCRAAANLPLDAQARLARVVAKEYDAPCLKRLLDALHQLITTRVFAGQMKTSRYCVNEDEVVMAATRTMKILFYAAILGGVRPSTSSPTTTSAEEEEDAAMMAAIEDDNDHSNPGTVRDLVEAAAGAAPSKERRPAREDPLARELVVRASDCRRPTIPLEDFYNEPLNDQLEVDKDFTNFKAESDQPRFSFMNYAFILTPATKATSLYYDNRVRMYSERRISVLQSMVRNEPNNPYLKLKVRRDHIISDALIELEMVAMENPNDLKKQLVVEFEAEQGIDEGGVSKEFFQLVVDEIFNPDFGMFTLNAETQMYWFNPSSFESDGQFMLIGIVLGLAIYNNVILDIHLPHVVYRKLMNKRGQFEDLADLDPALYQGLVELKNHTNDDDVEDVFMQTFRISYKDIFGTQVTHLLKENGDQIPVNNSNKKEFIDMYADFLLNKSIERQFRAFRRGFQIVTDESPLKWLFRPEEVELLVCGSNLFDFNALEESTEYDGGYSATTATIRQFWEIVHDLSDEEKRKLLQFTTGSDRAPVGGLSKLKLIISRNGPDSNRLPTAHTCFNVLLLPEYSTKEKLKDRLLKAINYSKGFGML